MAAQEADLFSASTILAPKAPVTVVMPKKPAQPKIAVAQYDFDGQPPDELSFKAGAIIQVEPQPVGVPEDPDWLLGTLDGTTAYVPRDYVVIQDPDETKQAASGGPTALARKDATPEQPLQPYAKFADEKVASDDDQSKFAVQLAASAAMNSLQLEGVTCPSQSIPTRFLDRFEPIWRLPAASQLLAVDCVDPKSTNGQLDIEIESLVPSITFIAEILGGIECSMPQCNEAAWDLRTHLQDAACVQR